MSGLGLNFLIAIVYALLMGEMGLRQLLTGFAVGLVILNLFPKALGSDLYVARGRAVWRFTAFFFKSLVVANVQVAFLALQPKPKLTPLIIDVPLKFESHSMQTLLVATITLLPGTVAMGFNSDRTVLYAHSIGIADPVEVRSSIIEVEYYILDIMFPLDYPGGHRKALEDAAMRTSMLAKKLASMAEASPEEDAGEPSNSDQESQVQQEQLTEATKEQSELLDKIVEEVKA